MRTYEIAAVHGDRIGPEVCKAALGFDPVLRFVALEAGADLFRRTGVAYPAESFAACRRADAILHGAAGLPGVLHSDGTEAGLETRFRLDLYANVRPIRLFPGIRSRLAGQRGDDIDFGIMRENAEGRYAARGGGVVLRDEMATDSMELTRKGTERVARAVTACC